MQRIKLYIWSAMLLSAVMISGVAVAQDNTQNVFSAYTMYGLGQLQTQGTLVTRSMGGAGVAMRSVTDVNILNPASYSTALRKGVLFDFGLEGAMYMASQNIEGAKVKSTNSTFNFHDIALQLPLTKGLGLGFSLTPYSSVGYTQEYAYSDSSLGYINMINEGSGDVTDVKLGVGWELVKGLSIGASAQYYWGDIYRYFSADIWNIVQPGTVNSPSGVDNISISSIKAKFGVQAQLYKSDKSSMRVGATYDLGGDLKPRHARAVSGLDSSYDISALNDTTTMEIVLPRALSVGLDFTNDHLMVNADVTLQNWKQNNSTVEYTTDGIGVAYTNVMTLRLGMQYIPNRVDVRNYLNRVSYRVGANYGGYQYTFGGESVSQYNVTAGFGFPINIVGISKVDLGFEWGSLGSHKNINVDGAKIGLVKQNTFKFALGFTMFGDDYWFQRPQID